MVLSVRFHLAKMKNFLSSFPTGEYYFSIATDRNVTFLGIFKCNITLHAPAPARWSYQWIYADYLELSENVLVISK